MALTPEQEALNFNPELQDVSRQRKLADLLMAQGMQQPQGQMISGRYVAPSWTQQLNPMANVLAGQAVSSRADIQQTKLAEALRQKQALEIEQFAELEKTDKPAALRFALSKDNPILRDIAKEELKGIKLGEGEVFTRQSLGGGTVELKGNPKYRAPLHFDVGNAIELRDPNNPTVVLQRIPKGVAPGEAARLGFEGIPYGGGGGVVGGQPQTQPQGQTQGQPFSAVKLPNGQTQQVDLQNASLMPPLITAGMSPKAIQEAKTAYAQDLQTNVNNAYQVYKVAGEIEKTLPKAHGSGIGNIMGGVANFVGYESKQNAADAELKVMSDKLLKAVPRFSGPQSDKDVQSYKEAAGSIGDASLPMNVRLAALNTIKNLNKPYAPNLDWESKVPKENEQQKVSLGAAPIYATNGSTRIMSTDGGKTWQPAR